VLLYARLVNGFKPDTELAILAGIPATFTLQLEVHQVRSFVWDKKITSHEIKRTIKYDNLKKTFSVYTNGNPQPVIFSDFESAQKSMADFNGIIAVPLASLVRGKNYYLLIKVKMDKARLPLHMEILKKVSKIENIDLKTLKERVRKGEIAILKNRVRKNVIPTAVGKGLRTKVTANIGTSPDKNDLKFELKKLQIAVEAGADTVMDLSTAGNLDLIRKEIIKNCTIPLGTVPIYQAVVETIKEGILK